MEKFMFIIREDLKRLSQLTEEERFGNMSEHLLWLKSLADSGNYLNGEPLAIAGRYVTRNDVVSDGPFIEAKEGVSGYDMIMAENINQAASIAQTCPLVTNGIAVIEVRPIHVPLVLSEQVDKIFT